jgi:DNA-binding transcriptional ArsR family regulator
VENAWAQFYHQDGCHTIYVMPCLDCGRSKHYNIFNKLNIIRILIDTNIRMAKTNPTESIFKALMHPSRMQILEVLRGGEQCVCHLEAVLGCRQAYISQHLIVLREAGLVEDRRDGARVFYRVTKPEVYGLIDYANKMNGVQTINVDEKVAGCACPKCASIIRQGNGQDKEGKVID